MKQIKILYFIESLRSGGKERRLVELIKHLNYFGSQEYKIILVLMDDHIHFTGFLHRNLKVKVLKRIVKKDPILLFRFILLCIEEKPDIIHVWGNMPAFYAIPSAKILKIPIINSQITDSPANISSGILSPKWSLKFSDFIISNSLSGLKAYGVNKYKNTKIIYNGFDFNRIEKLKGINEVKLKYNIKTQFVVGMVASYSDLKDYTTYIKAACIIIDRISEMSFLCIGSGDYSKYKQIIPKKYQSNFIFLNEQANIESIINIFDIGVLSTFTEGISNSIIEYMALGKPVIASDGGGTSELVKNGVNGFLVQSSNPELLASKLTILIKNKEIRKVMGKHNVIHIRKNFSMREMVKKHDVVYLNFIKDKNE